MNTKKETLRRKYRDIRLGMSHAEVVHSSQLICLKLQNEVNWAGIKAILAYMPIFSLREVDLALFIEKNKAFEIEFISNDKDQRLPSKKYDLILVPTLAFDKENYRLGWGGGFYDRLLATQPQAIKIGLCFQNGFIKDGLPHESHDIPLDKIVTEV